VPTPANEGGPTPHPRAVGEELAPLMPPDLATGQGSLRSVPTHPPLPPKGPGPSSGASGWGHAMAGLLRQVEESAAALCMAKAQTAALRKQVPPPPGCFGLLDVW